MASMGLFSVSPLRYGIYIFLAGILLEGMKQKSAKTAARLFSPTYEVTVQYNFVEKALCKVLGLFVIVAFAA